MGRRRGGGGGRRRRDSPGTSQMSNGEGTESENDNEETEGVGTEAETDVDISDPYIAGVRNHMENTIQFVPDILSSTFNDKDREEVVGRLKKVMLNLVKAEVNYVEGLKTVDRVASEMPELSEDADTDAILNSCSQLQKTAMQKVKEFGDNLQDTSLMRHKEYKRLLKEIAKCEQQAAQQAQNDGSDDDGEETELEEGETSIAECGGVQSELLPITDPITKTTLTDPVRNSICSHIYGRASILSLIKKNAQVRCPTLGCSNRHFVKKSHIVEEEGLQQKIAKKVRDAQRNARAKDDSTQVQDL